MDYKTKLRKYGERLKKLEGRSGTLTPNKVLDDARRKDSPLHDYFEWDNGVAGERWRVNQARELIREYRVDVKLVGGGVVNIPKYFSITAEDGTDADQNNRVYVSYEKAKDNPVIVEKIVLQALDEANSWRERYRAYSELRSISDAIVETRERLRISSPGACPV